MKKIILLGATGSIGTQVLEIVRENKEYELVSISVGRNIEKAYLIVDEFRPKYVSTINQEDSKKLKERFPYLEVGFGEDGLIKAATFGKERVNVINAVVGMVGLIPTVEAIKKGNNILLANKETLVCAGEIITRYVNDYNVKLIPIDSEHSTVLQCLQSGRIEDVNRIVLTASGGSFRDKTRVELNDVTVLEALKHPNWQMGAKITIDSATMVNKGLEIIEAHHLFSLDYDKIETVIHKESIIHSLVEYNDGTIIAGLSYPDMKIPIQYALSLPNRYKIKGIKNLNLKEVLSLNFSPMDYERFPLVKLAYEVGKMGGIMPMVYNSANEIAVKLFLDGKIKFLDIEDIIFYAVKNTQNIQNPTLEEIISYDKLLRKQLLEKFEVK